MRLHELELRDFRNFTIAKLCPSPRFTVFSGANGQGKTNLLEAAYLACCQRSFRSPKTADLIRFGAHQARLRAKVELQGINHDVRIDLLPKKKTAHIDEKRTRGPASWPTGLTAIVFTPDDLQVPRGSPGDRRRLLDRAVASAWSGHLLVSRDYQRVLNTRNRLLRERLDGYEALLSVYDTQLSGLGAKLALARLRYLRALAPQVSQTFARILGRSHPCGITYQSPCIEADQPVPALGELAARIARRLQESRTVDLARKQTTTGPHTDDVAFSVDGRPARTFASQGQTRALVLALKIAQIIDTYDRFQHYPLLLLDDVSSELDPERNAYLFDFLNEIDCQILVSTTRPQLVTIKENRLDFSVLQGSISRF